MRCTNSGWSGERWLWMASLNQVSQQHDMAPFISFCSLQISPCSQSRKHLPFWQTLLSPSPACINSLCRHTDCLHLISELLVTLWDSKGFSQPDWVATCSHSHYVMAAKRRPVTVNPLFLLPKYRNLFCGLDKLPCSGELVLYQFYTREEPV